MFERRLCDLLNHHSKKLADHALLHSFRKGDFPEKDYIFFIQQDWIYLKLYLKMLQATAQRLPKLEHQQLYHTLSRLTETEIKIQNNYLAYHENPSFFKNNQNPITNCLPSITNYIKHLEHCLASQKNHLLVSATFPCFYLYDQIGKTFEVNDIAINNPYRPLLLSYKSDEFVAYTKAIQNILQELIAPLSTLEQREALQTIEISCSHENHFWDEVWSYHCDNEPSFSSCLE